MIPFRVKLLTDTAKAPEKANESDLWDLFVDNFCKESYFSLSKNNPNQVNEFTPIQFSEEGAIMVRKQITCEDAFIDEKDADLTFWVDKQLVVFIGDGSCILYPQGRILVKTGIAIELPIQYSIGHTNESKILIEQWLYNEPKTEYFYCEKAYAVADIRPRSGLALKHGITVLNSPGTIDNSYRKEIGVILINQGHEPYKINKGDKIAQMLIRPLYPSRMEIISEILDTNRGGYGSTGK